MVEYRLSTSILMVLGTLMLSSQDVSAYRGKHEGGLITQCEYPGTKGLFISREKYSYQNATSTCQKLGGSLVDLTNQNILLASDLLLTCVGPNSKAWVGSWDYRDDNFDVEDGVHDCLSLVVSNIGPSGTVSKICKGDRPVLCQNHDSPVEHNPFYSQPAWSSKSHYPKPTRVPDYVDLDDEDDEFDYPVFYPKPGAGVYPPPTLGNPFEPAAYQPARAPLKPVFYPKPDANVYGSHRSNRQPVFYPRPGRGSPRRKHWKQNRYPKVIEPVDEEDCETWTLDGVITTITKPQTEDEEEATETVAMPEIDDEFTDEEEVLDTVNIPDEVIEPTENDQPVPVFTDNSTDDLNSFTPNPIEEDPQETPGLTA